MTHLAYLHFCQPTSSYYELPSLDDPDALFGLHRRQLADGWARTVNSEWVMYTPPHAQTRWQGWKIHVSGTMANAVKLLDAVADYCLPRAIPFKALASESMLARRNTKYADRGASGKFVTIYPADDEQFATILHDLDHDLAGAEGPSILSDLRWADGPLYVRYGAFVSRQVTTEDGRVVECIEDPDGQLVEDPRRPGFHPPAWVEIPPVLAPAVAAREARTLRDFPYRVRRALHFSNGGGVYLAERISDGTAILLKEARPHCGLDESGADAIARLEREHQALTDLAGLPGIPAVDAYLDGVEHRFLAREFVPGRTLLELAMERNPLVNPDSGTSRAQYVDWVVQQVHAAETILAAIHSAGYVFGDFHPGNIIVDDSGEAHVIDLESSSDDLIDYRQPMGVFGFRAPADYLGATVDSFAMACLRIALLLPMTRSLHLGPRAAGVLMTTAREEFSLPENYFDGIAQELAWASAELLPGHDTPDTPDLLDRLGSSEVVAATLAGAATPDRDERLFPGDIAQFLEPGAGSYMAFGAAGAIWSLRACGQPVAEHYLEWLRHRALGEELTIGFWSGLAGIAYALDGLDDTLADACRLAAQHRSADTGDLSMARGLAGLGLYLATLPNRNESSGAALDRLGERVLDLGAAGALATGTGLCYGASGIALFATRALAATGDARYRRLAAEVLREEVSRFGVNRGGSLALAALPAQGAGLSTGVLGLGLALEEYRRTTGEQEFAEALARTTQVAGGIVVANGGVFTGRAGVIQFLLAVGDGRPHLAEVAQRHRHLLRLTAQPTDTGAEVLGEENLKFSHDFATGLAGVAVTLRASSNGAALLPLLLDPVNPR